MRPNEELEREYQSFVVRMNAFLEGREKREKTRREIRRSVMMLLICITALVWVSTVFSVIYVLSTQTNS